jgi:hypothetical protein
MFSISTKWWSISAVTILSYINFTHAQPVDVARYEVMLDRNETGYETISSNDHGLFLQRMGTGPKFNHIELIHLDTALSEKWNGSITVEKNYLVFGQTVFQNNLYLLLRYRDYSRNDLILIAVDNESGNYVQYKIKGYIPFAPAEFHVMTKGVVIGGYFNRTPLALYFSLEDFKSKVLAGLLNETGELNQIRVNDDETFDLLISAPNVQRQRTIWLKRYDGHGNLISNLSLESADKHLIFGRLFSTDDNMQIVAGVYGNRSTEYSRGIFISTIDPAGYQQTRYYSFGDLENFFKYMKAKREKRVKERIERRKIRGKKTKFNYRFLLHQVIPYNDQFLLLGEAFYPKYSYIDRNPYLFFSSRGNFGSLQNGRVFDGYYYTHAVIMAFNKKGDLLWDNSFEIKDVKSFKLEQFVRAKLLNDRIAMFYIYDNKLRSKIIQDNDVVEAKTQDLPHNAYEVNRPVGSTAATLNYWYDDVLFAYGMEDIETPGGRHKRRVFHISKIKVTTP